VAAPRPRAVPIKNERVAQVSSFETCADSERADTLSLSASLQFSFSSFPTSRKVHARSRLLSSDINPTIADGTVSAVAVPIERSIKREISEGSARASPDAQSLMSHNIPWKRPQRRAAVFCLAAMRAAQVVHATAEKPGTHEGRGERSIMRVVSRVPLCDRLIAAIIRSRDRENDSNEENRRALFPLSPSPPPDSRWTARKSKISRLAVTSINERFSSREYRAGVPRGALWPDDNRDQGAAR